MPIQVNASEYVIGYRLTPVEEEKIDGSSPIAKSSQPRGCDVASPDRRPRRPDPPDELGRGEKREKSQKLKTSFNGLGRLGVFPCAPKICLTVLNGTLTPVDSSDSSCLTFGS